jgi:hypothetical protein
MNPLINVKLPKLSDDVIRGLLDIAYQYKNFKYSNGTLGKKYHEEKESLKDIEKIKRIYGFNDLPQHRSKPVPDNLKKQILDELKVPILLDVNMYVQVIESRDTFIHTDGGHRICSLYYMMSDNGSNTTFYRSEKPPVLSTVWHPMDVYPYYTYLMKQHNWYTFSHNEIHSVNNIEGLRIGLILDFTPKYKTYEGFVSQLKMMEMIDA